MALEIAGFMFGITVIMLSGRCVLALVESKRSNAFGAGERCALSFLCGSLAVVVAQLYALTARVPLTGAVVFGYGLLSAGVSVYRLRRSGVLRYPIAGDIRATAASFSARETGAAAILVALCAGAIVICAGLPLYSWDAVATWSLKAKILYYRQAFYTPDFLDPEQYHNLRAYPLFISLVQNFLFHCMGGVNEHLVKIYFALTYAALTACVYGVQRGYFRLPRLPALLGTLGVAAIPVLYVRGNGSVPTAMVDVPQAFFLTCAVIAAMRGSDIAALASAAAVLAKNEGALVPLICLAVMAARGIRRGSGRSALLREGMRFCGIVAACVAPWFVARQSLPPSAEGFFSANLENAARLAPVILMKALGSLVFDVRDYGFFWWCVMIGIAAQFAARPRAVAAPSLYAIYAVGCGYIVCMAVVLAVSFCVADPPPLETHFAMGFHRLSLHAAPLLGIAASATFAHLSEIKQRA